MTEDEQKAEIEAIIRFQEENPDYWGGQDENDLNAGYSFDIDQLRENLKLTPAERLRRHGIRLQAALEIQQTKERNRTSHK
jgi:hypothetical protein